MDTLDRAIERRIARIQQVLAAEGEVEDYVEAGTLALSILHDTVGDGHPLAVAIRPAVDHSNWILLKGACRSVVALFADGGLQNPRLRIAHELDADILIVAKNQLKAADGMADPQQKQLRLATAAFLAGAALEDALRRLCDSRGVAYDPSSTSLSRLVQALYSPSSGAEVITLADHKNITAWGETRNNADHGRFSLLTNIDVMAMTIGIEAFLNRYLP
jgi:hypothetical protein